MEFDVGRKLCKILNDEGKECYVVGGAVRDSLMGVEVGDVDLTTDALPSETTKIFKNKGCSVIPVGEEFGTVMVRCDRKEDFVEVTTYRGEGEYTDKRHPDSVTFETELVEDLKRRDFTVNAIAFDPVKEELVDPLNGQRDIENRLLRAIGDAEKRFREDPLRMMRMCRFTGKGFTVDGDTEKAATKLKSMIQLIPAERVRDELFKVLDQDKPSTALRCFVDTGLMDEFLPEVSRLKDVEQPPQFHKYNALEHTLRVVDELPKKKELRLAGLLHDIGKGLV